MHSKSRRHFLANLSALGIAGLVGVRSAPARDGAARGPTSTHAQGTLDLARVTCAEFAACLGTTFRIMPENGSPVAVELVRAREQRRAATARGEVRNPFSLIFRGDGPAALPQQTYWIEHSRLGAFQLFIVPIVAAGNTTRYQAIFG